MTDTLLYLVNATPQYTPANIRGSFTNAPALARRLCLGVFGSAVAVTVADGTSTTANQSFLFGRWIGDGIVKAGTLSGTMQIVMAVKEASGQGAFTHVHAYVTAGNSATIRGTLVSNDVGSTEWPTTASSTTGRGITDTITINSVNVEVGDHVVIEVGYRVTSGLPTNLSASMWYGSEATTDLASGDTITTSAAKPGWVKFSDPNSVLNIPISDLVDEFDAVGDYDHNKWPNKSSSSITPTQSGGMLNVPTLIGGSQYLESNWTYTLAEDSISVQIIPPAINGSTAAYAAITAYSTPDFNDWVQIRLDPVGGFIGFLVVEGGTTVFNHGYSSPEPGAWVLDTPFVRIRETGGDLFFDVSPDGTNWVPMTDSGDPITVPTPSLLRAATDVTIDLISNRVGGGTSGTVAAPAQFDNFNFAPVLPGPEPGRMFLAVS